MDALIERAEYVKKLRSNLEALENMLRTDIINAMLDPAVEDNCRKELVDLLLEIRTNDRKEQ